MKWFALIMLVVFLVCVGIAVDGFDDVCLRRPEIGGC